VDTETTAWREFEGRAGQRIDEFLFAALPEVSRHGIRRLIAHGLVTVDGAARTAGNRLCAGERVRVPERLDRFSVAGEDLGLTVLFEDESIIAIDKPSGMLAHPTSQERTGTAVNALMGRLSGARPHLLHRLDRGTSGVLVAAKTDEAARELGALFETRQIDKRYLAIVASEPAWEQADVDTPIERYSDGRAPKWNTGENGAEALTRLTKLRGRLIQAEPWTGRTNQIRIHCASIGLPIVGDTAYGGPPAERLFLHALELEFRSGRYEGLTIRAPHSIGTSE
jgi:23S rRNA pseudouridine1911/1915/1917 synthase